MGNSGKKMRVSLNHISEVFLYEYFVARGAEYEIAGTDEAAAFKEKAHELAANGDMKGSLQEWIKAHFENPVDMEAILYIISCCKQLGDIEGEHSYTTESYNYCCTRAEMAAYYRNLGWYYLEKYNPDLACACYMYSQLFDKTKQAEDEVKFLEKALERKFEEKSAEELQEILAKNEIPTAANPVTLALLYKAGGEAEAAAQYAQALDCYRMVFDLTADEEVGAKIHTLQSKIL